MTGWRVGWAAGGERWIAALTKVKTFSDTGVPFTVQHAAQAALRSHEEWLPGNLAVFRRRRDAAVESLRSSGFDVSAPSASMYLWVPVPGGELSEPYARRLLLEQGVAVLPGSALGQGGEGFFRIALTVSEARLREAAERMGRLG
jgi:LL-diaminopimelate aminotransferase